MPKRTLQSTVAWGLILAWANGAAAQSVDLRPKFTTGRVTYYREISNEDMKMGDQGQQKSTTEVGFRCTVKRIGFRGFGDSKAGAQTTRYPLRSIRVDDPFRVFSMCGRRSYAANM